MRPHRDLLFPFWLSLLKRGGPRGKGVLLAISQAPYRPVCVDAIVLRNRLGTHKDQFLILSVGELRTLGSHFIWSDYRRGSAFLAEGIPSACRQLKFAVVP